MSELTIDQQVGSLHLPNGFIIEPSLTQNAFLKGPWSHTAKSWDAGTLPYIHYDLSGGQVMGYNLLVSMCFYDQMLLDVSLTISLYPPDATGWSHYSLDIEARTKSLHDTLLTDLLGKPTNVLACQSSKNTPENQKVLFQSPVWQFVWGRVGSYHDHKGGGTRIALHYGNRHEKADKTYRARR